MRVLLVSEGKHESEGAAETIVRRLSDRISDIEHDRLSRSSLRALFGRRQGYFKRALRWMLEARRRGFDAVVILVDQDRHPERVKDFDDAQDNTTIPFPRAIGVAIRTFDAWMLADEQAISRTLSQPVDRQRSPEILKDPKSVCANLLAGSATYLSLSQMYSKIAEIMNLEIVSERCPQGFSPFAKRVSALAQAG